MSGIRAVACGAGIKLIKHRVYQTGSKQLDIFFARFATTHFRFNLALNEKIASTRFARICVRTTKELMYNKIVLLNAHLSRAPQRAAPLDRPKKTFTLSSRKLK